MSLRLRIQNIWIFPVLLLVLGISNPASAQTEVIDVVFDLDWTLVGVAPDVQGPGKHAPVDPAAYRITDGTDVVWQSLLFRSTFRSSVYSGGEVDRNLAVLQRIKVGDARSALDFVHRTLSKPDLVPTLQVNDTSLPDRARYKKDLSLIDGVDLERTIILEDLRDTVLPSQHRNVLWLGPGYEIYETYEEVEAAKAGGKEKYMAPNRAAWALERNKLFRALGLIVDTFENYEREGVSFVEALYRRQRNNDGSWIDVTDISQRRFFERGLAEVRKNFPKYSPPVPFPWRAQGSQGIFHSGSRQCPQAHIP